MLATQQFSLVLAPKSQTLVEQTSNGDRGRSKSKSESNSSNNKRHRLGGCVDVRLIPTYYKQQQHLTDTATKLIKCAPRLMLPTLPVWRSVEAINRDGDDEGFFRVTIITSFVTVVKRQSY